VPLDVTLRQGTVGIVTLKNRTLSSIAQQFIETARELAKSLAGGWRACLGAEGKSNNTREECAAQFKAKSAKWAKIVRDLR
jgi:hypothetical protein